MKNYYEEIKHELINNEVYSRVKDYSKNKHDLETRYNVGKLLIEAQGGEERAKYGDGLIKEYSKKLTKELGKQYNVSDLKRMRQFYLMIRKGVALPHQLSWSHIISLLPINNVNKINYYINMTIKSNIGYRELRNRIKSNEYERLPKETKEKLSNNIDPTLPDIIKDPIIINNPNNIEVIKEKTLQLLIMENLFSFLKELGEGFMYVGNEYPIKIGDNYNYIDILLFNIKYNSYVVIELKLGKLKKEHIGQIETYMNYIDKNIKEITNNKTIGIILCRENDKFIMEYCSDNRIISREYILN